MSVVKLWLATGMPRCSAQRGDLQRLGQAAAGQVDLDHADAALVDQPLEAAQRALLLAGGEALADVPAATLA